MFVQEQVIINSSKEQIWKILSDIENASKVFNDIKSIEILEKPKSEILDLKWKEIREFMGKEATETMWIIDVTAGESYTAEAKNSGCLYHSSFRLRECEGGVEVSKSFKSTPQTLLAKIMSPVMLLMKGMLKKCLMKDLNDLKAYLDEK